MGISLLLKSSLRLLLIGSLSFCFFSVQAQDYSALIQTYLQEYAETEGLTATDISQWEITNQYTTKHNGVTHIHIRQTQNGLPVYNAVANITIHNGQILKMASRLEKNLAQRANSSQPTLTPKQAIEAAATVLDAGVPSGLELIEKKGPNDFLYSKGGISFEDIPVKLMYQPGPEGELFLVWDLSISTLDSKHWWSARIDALNGALRDTADWVTHCTFPNHPQAFHAHRESAPEKYLPSPPPGVMGLPGNYRVFSYRIESPNHGPRTLEVEPADSVASPFGWHDTDGVSGAEYTITRGNNVLASEDRDANNAPGFSPDGGASLNFDFPLNINQDPANYDDVAVTNLFYMNNIMHDLWYQYGFDEVSGNFQENNYGNGGIGGDYVNADAQDGAGINNANFATPPDGNNPRMQMFLWAAGSGADSVLTINSPASIAGGYVASGANFGPPVPTGPPITADVVLVNDGTNPDPEDACDPIINGAALNGKIALIDRGNCNFADKVEAVQNAGAVAAIIVNNVGGGTITMGGFSGTVTIPSIMISLADGNAIKAEIAAGSTVNATLQDSIGSFDRDGDFDNGIIAHEYGHGISIRLTGGAGNSGCLSGGEQMGEGWSDWFGIMMNLDPNMVNRGIGTFAINEPINGIGIRNAPYSPDFSVNPFTYDDTNDAFQVSQPHGVGFVWATMLWDLALAFIDEYGYDPDVYYGNGGNNMVMQLVIDGIKLQPCGPGFVDGRDAILLADQINNGGANQCLIWEVFANRGLGLSASQGSANSRTDQVEAFDLPAICLIPTKPPSAVFNHINQSSCNDEVQFTDQSTDIPQSWFWDFGDGNTDTVQNPVHIYTASGTYTVTMIASNTLGSDTIIQTVTITLPAGPVAADAFICENDSALLAVSGTGTYNWFDKNGALLDTGITYQTAAMSVSDTFFVSEKLGGQISFGGPVDGSFAAGGYHNTGFTGTVNFEAFNEFTLVSVWVNAGSAGPRTIYIWDSYNGAGNVVDQVTINIPQGPQRVTLNLEVPGPGLYSAGGTSIDMYRNSAGATYPYVIPGILSMNSSSATTNPAGFYYYLYDWEVKSAECNTDKTPVAVTVSNPDFSYVQDSLIKEVTFTDLSAGASSWLWDFGDGNTSTQQNPSNIYPGVGLFVVSLTVNGNCTLVDTINILPSTGLETLVPGLELSLIPNPAADRVSLTLSEIYPQDLEVSLSSIEGKMISTRTLKAGATQLSWDVSDLPPAIYLVKVVGDEGQRTMRLMVSPK